MASRRRKLYHGTSSIFLPEIKSQGLLGRSANVADYDEVTMRSTLRSTRGRVYVTLDPSLAASYATTVSGVYGGDPIVLEVSSPLPLSIDPELRDFELNPDLTEEQFLNPDSFYIKGRIAPRNIKSIRPAEYYDEDTF